MKTMTSAQVVSRARARLAQTKSRMAAAEAAKKKALREGNGWAASDAALELRHLGALLRRTCVIIEQFTA